MAAAPPGFSSTAATIVVIRNCFVRDYNGDGISFQQSNDVEVDGCVVDRCAGFGLHPGSGSQRPVGEELPRDREW